MPTNTFDAGNVPDLLSVQVSFSQKVILDITKQETVFALFVYKVTHSLGVVKFRFAELPLFVANFSITDLLNKLVRRSVKNQVPVV